MSTPEYVNGHLVTRDETGMRICNLSGCAAKHRARGLCSAHLTISIRDHRESEGLPRKPYSRSTTRRNLRRLPGQLCKTKGCKKPVHAKELCHSCYPKYANRGRSCSVVGCSKQFFARDMCKNHYQQDRNRTDWKPVRPRRLAEDRFRDRVANADAAGCMLWHGTIDQRTGRGTFTVTGQRVTQAHRYAYELAHGPVPRTPDGKALALDHRCRVPLCMNVEHLEPVTSAENTRRGLVAAGHRNISEADAGWFFVALRAFVEGADNFPARTSRRLSRATAFVVDGGVAA